MRNFSRKKRSVPSHGSLCWDLCSLVVLSLKCFVFVQARYREKEEELAETIDRLEEEMRSALASREEEHEQSVEQIERRQIDETKGLKEEFRKDQEA